MAKGKYKDWLTEDALLLLSAWARDGATDREIAEKMGIAESTLYDWKNKYKEISEALKKNKELADIEIENALYKKALGFKETVKKPIRVKHIEYVDGKRDREHEEVVQAEEEVYIPPDVAAQGFWLKNRQPSKWRDRPADDGKADMKVILQNIRAMDEIISSPMPDRRIEDFE